MSHNSNTYVIVPVEDITMNMVMETSSSASNCYDFTKNVDGSLVILKFSHCYPNYLGGYEKYNHDEISAILETEEWLET